ncbi:hypothetical protein SKAU_G00110110 [Synaphobranchus kaupii]|uniref:Uncharacterized protein n=1 Tax=Synaphobranchus kaupii TaxID=118154 RepID=A0A9Q1J8D4_SYNKA|nr:hypothetical protein SKAU_G00110110 [Synaphobranchus kaupii]
MRSTGKRFPAERLVISTRVTRGLISKAHRLFKGPQPAATRASRRRLMTRINRRRPSNPHRFCWDVARVTQRRCNSRVSADIWGGAVRSDPLRALLRSLISLGDQGTTSPRLPSQQD